MKGYIEKNQTEDKAFSSEKEGQSGEEYARQRVLLGLKYGVFALTAFAILRGMLVVAGENVTVSNSVDGRELPIYCVDTPEKKIALSFDAAWGNEDTTKILEILKKHDIHVTFFMTGGWVESYPDDVKAILAEAGLDISDVSQTTVFLADMGDFGAMNEVYASQFEGAFPARSAVAVKTLPKNGLVEIEVIAVKA